jgi:hypothetical protein
VLRRLFYTHIPEFPIFAALAIIVYVRVLLSEEGKEAFSNQIATFAYYLLIIGIIWNLIQYIRNRSTDRLLA